jgi:hypothetical protein
MGEAPHKVSLQPTDGGAAQGTTTFTASTEAVPYERPSSSVDPQNDTDLEVDCIRDIADFMAKPVNIATGSFTTANVAGDQLYTDDIVSVIEAQQIWTNKLAGFLNYRGCVKLRLVVNPTPFQAGLLRLSYFPCANQMGNEAAAHVVNRVTTSQIPGTYLNLNDNFCEVSIPYIAPTSFLQRDNIVSGNHVSWGRMYIHVFEPLRTGTGPTSVQWTLWMSVEDLEVSGMVQPQMAEPKKRRGRQALDAEQNSGKGPIAKIMSSGVKLASDISALPSLAPLAKPAAWALSIAEGVADAFGWAKPTQNEGTVFQARNLHWFMANSDGNDMCAPLSLRSDNKVVPITDASPGGVDEMSIDFLKTRWGFTHSFEWDTSSGTGTLLFAHQTNPSSFQQPITVSGLAGVTNIPVGALSKFYNHYRGSFEYRLRIVKTGFHTGALAITWTPGEAAVTPAYNQTPYMYRQIIDIQEGGDYIFNVPYLVAQDYLRTDEYSGVITVHVVNPLQAPVSVSPTVDIMVEVRGGPDLTFTQPSGLYDSVPFCPQGIDVQGSGQATAISLGSSIHQTNSVHHALLANGELQLSVADILKAQCPLRWTDPSGLNYGGRPALLASHQIYATRNNAGVAQSSPLGGDLVSFIGSWYALQRGSQRYRVLTNDEAGGTLAHYRSMYVPAANASPQVFSVPGASGDTGWGQLLAQVNGWAAGPATGRLHQMTAHNGGQAVQIPFYSKYRYNLAKWAVANGTAHQYSTQGSLAVCPRGSGQLLCRAIGDDFHFSYFVGIPLYTSCLRAGWVNTGS